MPYEWVYNGFGGALAGTLAVLLVVVISLYYRDLKGQIERERVDKERAMAALDGLIKGNGELRTALDRLTETVQSWMPQRQTQRRLPPR